MPSELSEYLYTYVRPISLSTPLSPIARHHITVAFILVYLFSTLLIFHRNQYFYISVNIRERTQRQTAMAARQNRKICTHTHTTYG